MIKQREERDCAICCFAAASGLPYEIVRKRIGDLYDPEIGTMGRYESLFKLVGIEASKAVIPTPGRPALVSYHIRWIKEGELRHMCYWDGMKMHNPGHGGAKLGPIREVWEIA